jgi:flagellar motor switch protein FliG
MFTFADIVTLTDREMQVLLRVVDPKDLVVALKSAPEALKDKILGNLSEQARQALTEEMEFIGPVRLSEVEEVQLRIVQQLRKLEKNGELTLVRGRDADDSFA